MLATKFSQFFCYKPYDFFNKTKTVCGLQKWRKNSNGNRMWKEKTYTFAYNKFNTFQYFWRVLPLFQYSISQQLREVRLRLHDEPKDPDLGDEKKSVRPRELYWATYLENWGVSTITGAAIASQRNNRNCRCYFPNGYWKWRSSRKKEKKKHWPQCFRYARAMCCTNRGLHTRAPVYIYAHVRARDRTRLLYEPLVGLVGERKPDSKI